MMHFKSFEVAAHAPFNVKLSFMLNLSHKLSLVCLTQPSQFSVFSPEGESNLTSFSICACEVLI